MKILVDELPDVIMLRKIKGVLNEALTDIINEYRDKTIMEVSITHNPKRLCSDIHIVFKGR